MIKGRFNILSILLAVCVVQWSFVQQKNLSGTVTDQDGTPLPGANIVVKATDRSVQTDFDGDYTIDASAGEILVFSYIGQKTTEQTVGAPFETSISSDSWIFGITIPEK